MENETKTTEDKNKMLIPASIIVAGLLIAFAVMYTLGNSGVQAPRGKDNIANTNPAVADILKIREGDFVLGDPKAKVLYIEYGDFQCPYCGVFYKTIEPQIVSQYVEQGKVAFVWRDFAFLDTINGIERGESHMSAEAARCAGEQGKFWEYHDKLFANQKGENQGAFAAAKLKKFAGDLGLDQPKFSACLDSGKYTQAVKDSTSEGNSVGVDGTPASFINGRLFSGAPRAFSDVKTIIDQALAAK